MLCCPSHREVELLLLGVMVCLALQCTVFMNNFLSMQRELEPLECLNCGVRWAPMPRQGMCNACGIYAANNKRSRPLALAHKLMKSEPWKFSPDTPPSHVLKTKDNGKTVAVPLEDFEASLQADDNINSQPDSRHVPRWSYQSLQVCVVLPCSFAWSFMAVLQGAG